MGVLLTTAAVVVAVAVAAERRVLVLMLYVLMPPVIFFNLAAGKIDVDHGVGLALGIVIAASLVSLLL